MFKDLWVIIVGLIGGAAVGIQSPIAGAMGQKVGGTASSFIIHLSGMILSGVLLFLRGGEKIRNLEHIAMVYARSRSIWSHPLSNH